MNIEYVIDLYALINQCLYHLNNIIKLYLNTYNIYSILYSFK